MLGAFALVLIPMRAQVAGDTDKTAAPFPLWMAEASHKRVIAWAKAHAKTLFVVGDPNQAIYEFRGSVPEGMGELLEHVRGLKGITPDLFDSAREVAMLENRRSTSTIVALGRQGRCPATPRLVA